MTGAATASGRVLPFQAVVGIPLWGTPQHALQLGGGGAGGGAPHLAEW